MQYRTPGMTPSQGTLKLASHGEKYLSTPPLELQYHRKKGDGKGDDIAILSPESHPSTPLAFEALQRTSSRNLLGQAYMNRVTSPLRRNTVRTKDTSMGMCPLTVPTMIVIVILISITLLL
eukprot:Sspe_Gene.93526::Locus_66140_Transcript_1_1_Confidence_1.000_Length_513::g.93526::m.93526